MRVLSIIIVGFSLTIVIVTWLERAGSARDRQESPFANQIRITGAGNTLASVARRVNDPHRFRYDPVTRTAVGNDTLIIEGELQLGRPDDPSAGECLELATEVCGDLRIEVPAGGALRLYHSTIRTVSQMLSNRACSQGYSLFVDGTLTMDHSRVTYISGSTSQCLRKGARATIRQSTFSQCDGSALSCMNVDGRRIIIEDSEIIGAGNLGLVVFGSGGAPLEIRNCVLEAQDAAVFLTGESPHVRLVDCDFDSSKIKFHWPSGQVTIAWTRHFKVIDAETAAPRAGLLVRARSAAPGMVAEPVEARTNADGVAEMVLTDWVARPAAVARADGSNTATPYEVSVIREDGQALATIAQLAVRGKDPNPVVIELQ